MRERILSEIKRIAENDGGRPPGKAHFARLTSISEHHWSGVIWARWSDALAEAGYGPNVLQGRFNTNEVLTKIIEACRYYGRVPTIAEFKLSRLRDPAFPSKGAISGHFPTKAELLAALARRASQDEACRDIATMLPDNIPQAITMAGKISAGADGFVYLIKSGEHYKIGRSDELERRVKEIRLALPQAAILAHAIRTDDPSGIEAYWHKRFADRRANGEWFRLAPSDVAAFKRRKFQ